MAGRREGKRPERVNEEKETETAGARSRCRGDAGTSLRMGGERVATGEVHDNRRDATAPRTQDTRLVPDIRQEETENVEGMDNVTFMRERHTIQIQDLKSLNTPLCISHRKKKGGAEFPGVPGLGLGALTAEGPSSVPGWGTKMLQAAWSSQKKER